MSVIETTAEIGNLDSLVKDLNEAVAQPDVVTDVVPDKKEKPSHIPDKFWDAEKGEILVEKMAQSYTNLESSHGRMANDLGTQRKLTDRLLDLKRSDDLSANGGTPAKLALPDVKGTDLLDDPVGTITKVVEATNQHRDAAAATTAQEQQAAQRWQQFTTNHPDFETVSQSPEFIQWVGETPTRKRLGQIASTGHVDSADDLLTEFKGRKTVNDTEAAALEAARKAGLENNQGGAGGGSKGSGKIYRRVDLLRLKQERPDDYYSESYQAEILKAYAENRVK